MYMDDNLESDGHKPKDVIDLVANQVTNGQTQSFVGENFTIHNWQDGFFNEKS